MKKFFTLLCWLAFVVNNNAQKELTLDDAIEIALRQSFGIQSAKYSLESSGKNLEAVKLGLLSSLDLEFDLPSYFESLSSQFNTSLGKEEFYEYGSTKFEGRLSLRQPLIFSDGLIRISGSIFGRDQFGSNQETTKDYYTNLSIGFSQPLFTFNTQKANLTKAEINLEKAKRNFTQAELDVIYNITVSFYSLFRSKESMKISEEKVAQNEESYQTANNKFKAGLIAEVEKLQLEVDLASSKNELLSAKRSYEERLNDFKILIGIPIEEQIEIVSRIEYKPVDVDLNDAIKNALANRPDLLDSKDDIYLSELNIDEVDSRKTIKAEINARYGINRNDEKLKNIFSEFLDDRRVSLTLSVPVWDWGKNAREVESAEANFKLQQLRYDNLNESIKNEIISAVNRLNSAKARVEVLSKTVEVAEKSYKISLERFKSGTITSFDLSQMQIRVTEAKLNSLSALIDYKQALADLERKTLTKYE